jgi:hypothetical protein
MSVPKNLSVPKKFSVPKYFLSQSIFRLQVFSVPIKGRNRKRFGMGKGGDGKRVGTEKREGKLSKAKQGCILKRLGIDNKKRLGTEKG